MNIGILNSGGDAPGLNAVIEGAVAAATARGWTVYGFYDGFEGLLSTPEDERWKILTTENCHNIRSTGGTILGTTNKGHFTVKSGVDGRVEIAKEVLDQSKATVERPGLSALLVVGGDGSQTIGLELRQIGLPIVGVPKTIDNDLGATDYTFGFWTAVNVVSQNLDRLRTTADSHQRIMVVEVMGRHAGWIALYGGLAGGADLILCGKMAVDGDTAQIGPELARTLGIEILALELWKYHAYLLHRSDSRHSLALIIHILCHVHGDVTTITLCPAFLPKHTCHFSHLGNNRLQNRYFV